VNNELRTHQSTEFFCFAVFWFGGTLVTTGATPQQFHCDCLIDRIPGFSSEFFPRFFPKKVWKRFLKNNYPKKTQVRRCPQTRTWSNLNEIARDGNLFESSPDNQSLTKKLKKYEK